MFPLRGAHTRPGPRWTYAGYHNWFSNFIYEDLTGEVEDGLPVYQFAQAKARYYGFEVQGSVDLAKFGEATVVADALADYVPANIVSVGPAPRISTDASARRTEREEPQG